MGGRKGSGGYARVTGGRTSRSGGDEFQKEKEKSVQEVLKDFDHVFGRREIERDIKQIIQDAGEKKINVQIDDDGSIKVSKEAFDKATKLAEKIADRVEFVDEEADRLYNMLKPSNDAVYYLPKDRRSDLDGDPREYQQRSKFRFNSDSNNMSVDRLYETIYNDGKNPYGLTGVGHPAERLKELNNTLNNLSRNRTYDVYSDKAKHEFGGSKRIIADIRDSILENTALASYFYNSGAKRRRSKQ